jgi:predicted dehydrogenase
MRQDKRTTRRSFLGTSLAGGLALSLPLRGAIAAPATARVAGANGDIRIAMIGLGGPGGVGGRGRQLLERLEKIEGVRVAALCDVDEGILNRGVKAFQDRGEKVKAYQDLRKVLDDPEIDAVAVALPNHWHVLAAVWACEAGKDVYVEKPVSYNIWEGRQLVEAARKYGRIVQVGMQSRSSPDVCQAREFIRSGQMGRILYAYAVNYKRRDSIGKVAGPQPIPPEVDYGLWCGPAPLEPLMRKELHYDWHWDWTTGNGEMGNNGVHFLDMCRWITGQEELPPRAMSLGGRFGYDDDAETPNTHVAMLGYPSTPIFCEIRGLPDDKGADSMHTQRGVDKGIIVQCEGGHFAGAFLDGAAYDKDGREIKKFGSGLKWHEMEILHMANFLDAVRSRKADELNTPILAGHLSAALCHMANVSYRVGAETPPGEIAETLKGNAVMADAFERCRQHLSAHGMNIEKTPVVLGPWVTIDGATEQFVGEYAERANELSRRAYRKPFVVPQLA